MKVRRSLGFAIGCVLMLAGCGGATSSSTTTPTKRSSASAPAPKGDVAIVAGKPITLASFDHWLGVFNYANTAFTSTGITAVPKPPDYAACIASERSAAKASQHLTTAKLLARCRTDYADLKDEAMGLLIHGDWVIDEAAKRGVSVSASTLSKDLQTVKRTEFPDKNQFADYLRDSGESTDDVLYRLRIDLLTERLNDPAAKLAAQWRPRTSCAPAYAVTALCGATISGRT